MNCRALAVLPFLACLALVRAPAAPVKLEQGAIEGALYTIARPAAWNGRLLILAHGFRPADQPLHAELHETKPPVRGLLDQGWMVAVTSYRRNGIIIRDAVADIEALRALIAARYREPVRTYLLGESMGGLIVALIAEHHPDAYAGGVAIGAALEVREPAPTIGLEMRPQRPLIFLTNRSELGGPERYVAATRAAEAPPVLWRVERDGHVNVNAAEKLAALSALAAWAETGVRPPDNHAATLEPPIRSTRVVLQPDGSASGRITDIHPVYGNLTLDFQPSDLEQLGIARGTWFALILPPLEPAGTERLLRVFYGSTFSSVKRGAWVGFPEAEGWFMVAVNRGSAAEAGRLRVGDAVRIRRLVPEN